MTDDPRDLLDVARDAQLAEAAAELGNVLEFRRRGPEDDAKLDALAHAPRPAKACAHRRVRYIDDKQRTVTCGDCGSFLDPIWCLLTLVEYRESLRRERQWIESERAKAEQRRQAAQARRQRQLAKLATVAAQTTCERCSGSGWVIQGDGARRCDCRISGPKMV